MLPAQDAPTPSQKYDFSRQAGHLLRKAYQKNLAIFQNLRTDPNLTAVQLAALYAVANQCPCSLTDIGNAAAIDPMTTRGVIERLAGRGMVSLSADPTDGRKVIVAIEQPGVDLVDTMIPRSEDIGDKTLEPLTDREKAQMIRLLRKITEGDTHDKESRRRGIGLV